HTRCLSDWSSDVCSSDLIAFTPFDAAAASKIQHFETYNRTVASQRVSDIVSAIAATPGAAIVASGDSALAALLAAAIVPPRVARSEERRVGKGGRARGSR